MFHLQKLSVFGFKTKSFIPKTKTIAIFIAHKTNMQRNIL